MKEKTPLFETKKLVIKAENVTFTNEQNNDNYFSTMDITELDDGGLEEDEGKLNVNYGSSLKLTEDAKRETHIDYDAVSEDLSSLNTLLEKQLSSTNSQTDEEREDLKQALLDYQDYTGKEIDIDFYLNNPSTALTIIIGEIIEMGLVDGLNNAFNIPDNNYTVDFKPQEEFLLRSLGVIGHKIPPCHDVEGTEVECTFANSTDSTEGAYEDGTNCVTCAHNGTCECTLSTDSTDDTCDNTSCTPGTCQCSEYSGIIEGTLSPRDISYWTNYGHFPEREDDEVEDD